MTPEFSAVIRDLEMLLDQLYYWARRAQERRGGIEARMLEVATSNLEGFMGALIDCFRPIELAPRPMVASDLLAAITMRARDLGAASVTVTGEENALVSADPVRIGHALSGILRRLAITGAALHVTASLVRRGGRRGMEISLRIAAAPSAGRTDLHVAELDWAFARRIVALHAGEVEERPERRQRVIAVFLPVHV